jgi:hypothetical protein
MAGLTRAQFDELDLDGNGTLSRAELNRTANGNVGCNCATTTKSLTLRLSEIAGDLLLLACASLVLLSWPGSRSRTPRR